MSRLSGPAAAVRIASLTAAGLALSLVAPGAGAASSVAPSAAVGSLAEAQAAGGLAFSAPATPAGQRAAVVLALNAPDGSPVSGAALSVERRIDGAWRAEPSRRTASDGTARFTTVVSRVAYQNVYRVRFAGDDRAPAATVDGRVSIRKVAVEVALRAPARIRDERSTRLALTLRERGGSGLAGVVEVQTSRGSGWTTLLRTRTSAGGTGTAVVAPRDATRYRAVVRSTDWAGSAVSASARIDIAPYADPVRLPAGAPSPTVRVPKQPRATTAGADARVHLITDQVWRDMQGRSYRAGCPVGRSGLRLVRVNYIGFDGFRYRGEVVVASSIAAQTAAALTDLHDANIPLRSMHRVDRFGYSARLGGADDYASMAADNTSAFNCRGVVGRPSVRSPHSYGRSIDINPWENPYQSAQGVVPNTWWNSRSHPVVAWRSSSHRVVQIMARHGFRWTYGNADKHHFDGVPRGTRSLAERGAESGDGVIRPRGCTVACT